ncbi:DNA polymerase III subunit alpha [Candidatus Saccharibacteria bacterium]|nr:DNA polymerase III subunit alpha [Candidatus Saccharibacteria bacterium]MBI3338095.1 DNA polymerase III subunit alpha [Candidatus Saccharibacteria bacterium]
MASQSNLSPGDYVHLHNHTQYSLLDGLTKIPALIDRTVAMGMSAVAITDHGTLSGLIELYKEATAKNIQPLFGMETYIAARRHTDKEAVKDKTYYHLILIAMNETGYKNLMRLSTIANLDGFYYKPRIDHELLEKYNEGLIVLSGCIGGEVGDALRQDQFDQAKQIATWYKTIFGDRYYLEVQDHGHKDHPKAWQEQVVVTEETFKLSEELNIPCVVTCDAHYLKPEDQEAHEILLCVQTASFLDDENRMSLQNFDLHVTDPKEIIKRWGKDHPEIIKNTKIIADKCNVEIKLGSYLIPKFPVPKSETEKSFLDKLTYAGLVRRYAPDKSSEGTVAALKKRLPKSVVERAEYELGVIDHMGFNGYFLIVQDFINWGKDQEGIVFGPGRGSGAASIVAYALHIAEIDPLAYNLMFERFLNPDRISMPDFDIDIQDDRRDEVIQYCVKKYGTDRVANIVTFGRMAARNAVRDVARVLKVPYAEADRLAKMIPPPLQGRHIQLATSLKENNDLRQEYNTNEISKRVFDLAVQLEGTIRNHGVHAAGVIIAPDDIACFTPLEMAQKGVVATQYSMGPIEELGLFKIDFLGLSNLTIIKNTLRIIKKVFKEDIDINAISLHDKKTFELLARGDTTGVFQLESAGMKRYLKDLKPTVFEDIIAMVALYRPGPMAELPRFIEGKNNPANVTYPHPSLKPILGDTYGVMVFQEQIIALLQLIAGYTPGEADLIRKAIGKKKRDIMNAEQPRFIEGCLKRGLTKAGAEKLWALIQPFADYSFNKAHAACYGLIAYQTAYLKAHHPTAFMAALMTSDNDDTDRLAIEITECKHMGIEVLPPDINESFVEFGVVPETKQIRFGMAAIKNVGTGAVEEIIRARQIGGYFTNLEDFFSKVNIRIVNRKALESLIKAGALDRFEDRSVLLHNLDRLLAYAARLQKQASSGQADLFGNLLEETTRPRLSLEAAAVNFTDHEQLVWERELLGLYLSQHPLQAFEVLLVEQSIPISSLKAEHDNKSVSVGGAIQEMREITTKNGQKMAFVRIGDQFGEIELILFPSIYQQTTGIWERDKVILAKGKVTARDREGNLIQDIKVLVNDAREITPEQAAAYQATGKKPKPPKQPSSITVPITTPSVTQKPLSKLYIRLEDSDNSDILLSLKAIIDDHEGSTAEVVLVLGPAEQKQVVKLPMRINQESEVLTKLQSLVGAENVKLQ